MGATQGSAGREPRGPAAGEEQVGSLPSPDAHITRVQRVLVAAVVGRGVPLSSTRAADVEDLRRVGWRIAGSLFTQAGQLRLRDRGNPVFCVFPCTPS